jgi:AsmA protein
VKIFNKHFLLKILKITGITIAGILLLLFLLPILFPGTIGEKVKNFANERLKGELNFSKVRLSFFSHFPSFTVSLYDFSLKGSAPFTKDTLVASQEIAFGINLKSIVFDKNIRVDKIFISDAFINIQVNAKGEANYNVYTPPPVTSEQANDTASTALKLEMIKIINSQLVYNDKSVELLINARGLNYTGSGDLSKAILT